MRRESKHILWIELKTFRLKSCHTNFETNDAVDIVKINKRIPTKEQNEEEN